MRFLCEGLLTNSASVVFLSCVNLEVHPEVAGITEGLAAVLTFMRFHPYMPHEVNIQFSGCAKSPGTHAALELLLPHMALAFSS